MPNLAFTSLPALSLPALSLPALSLPALSLLAICRALAACAFLFASPLFAGPHKPGIQIDNLPRTLSGGEIYVVRLVEADPAAPKARVVVLFLDGNEEVVARHTQELGPGMPATFSIRGSELGSTDPLPAVRSIIRIVYDTGGKRFTTRPLATIEVIDELDLSVEARTFCKPPERSDVPEALCPEGVVTSFEAVD